MTESRDIMGGEFQIMARKLTILDLQEKKRRGEPITMLTGYDYPTALLEDRAGVDIILVGDSLGMTVLGMESTLPVTMDIMVTMSRAVTRAVKRAFVVGDMPYMSYQTGKRDAIINAGRLMQEAGVDCVKLEGGVEMAETVEALTKATIPVMGHIGLTPQSMSQLGGFRAQGRDAKAAKALLDDALALESAGACMILLEGIPPEVGQAITERCSVPIIGIGAGPHCDGQLLIVHDMLGFFDKFTPKFVKKYADMNVIITEAIGRYIDDVFAGRFPGPEHCYAMKEGELEKFRELLDRT